MTIPVTIRTELDGDVFAWKLDSTDDPELYQLCEGCSAGGDDDELLSVWWEVEEFPTPDMTAGGVCYCGTCASGFIADVSSAYVIFPNNEDGWICEGSVIYGFEFCEDDHNPDLIISTGLDLKGKRPCMDLVVCRKAAVKILLDEDERRYAKAGV